MSWSIGTIRGTFLGIVDCADPRPPPHVFYRVDRRREIDLEAPERRFVGSGRYSTGHDTLTVANVRRIKGLRDCDLRKSAGKHRRLFIHYLKSLRVTDHPPRHAQPLQDTKYWYEKYL